MLVNNVASKCVEGILSLVEQERLDFLTLNLKYRPLEIRV